MTSNASITSTSFQSNMESREEKLNRLREKLRRQYKDIEDKKHRLILLEPDTPQPKKHKKIIDSNDKIDSIVEKSIPEWMIKAGFK